MAANDKWYFTKEQLENSPSRKSGCDAYKELSYRQQAANFIQNMGQRLKVSQLCINTAIVYMHRFYVFHSFTKFPWHQIAAAALFLAAKVEEQPRKLEYVIRIANVCRYPRDTSFDITSERYLAQSQDLVFNENVLLQTLGFDVAIDHPHTHVVRCCQLVRASKDLAQTSYFMASNSLHLTTMCLQYKPTVVACFCIHLACKWSNWEIPLSNEKKEWFYYVDQTVTLELLQQLTEEFLSIFASSPSKLKEKVMAMGDSIHGHSPHEGEKKSQDESRDHGHSSQHDGKSDFQKFYDYVAGEDRHRSSRPHDPVAQREREYREKKERENLAMGHGSAPKAPSGGGAAPKPMPHGHHRHPQDPKPKTSSSSAHQRISGPTFPSIGQQRSEPRDILREAARDSPFGIAGKDAHHAKDKHAPKPVDLGKYPAHPPHDKNRSRVPDHLKAPPGGNKYSEQGRNSNVAGGSGSSSRTTHDRNKQETENIKKHLSAGPNPYVNKPSMNPNVPAQPVQKIKSPYSAIVDPSKSAVPKSALPNQPTHLQAKLPHHHNGNSSAIRESSINGSYAPQLHTEADKSKTDVNDKDKGMEEAVVSPPPIIKRPSLFSPEKTPPHQQHSISLKTSPNNSDLQSPSTAPVFNPPVETPTRANRSRNYSTGSEPELRPVMKKIDQVEGFENLQRETSIGINKLQHNSDVLRPKAEEKIYDAIKREDLDDGSFAADNKPLINGIETTPSLISSLLKETSTVFNAASQPIKEETRVDITNAPPLSTGEIKKEKEHHHHKSKKKNKEKHKHKDKDREKDREKKKKHKDKDREKHKHKDKHDSSVALTAPGGCDEPPKPLVIKIQKDKIQTLPEVAPNPTSLKIKIPKEKIKTEGVAEGLVVSQPIVQQAPLGGLKIKISKEVINSCAADPSVQQASSRKRERSSTNSDGPPPPKVPKNGKEKQNGRHSMHKAR